MLLCDLHYGWDEEDMADCCRPVALSEQPVLLLQPPAITVHAAIYTLDIPSTAQLICLHPTVSSPWTPSLTKKRYNDKNMDAAAQLLQY